MNQKKGPEKVVREIKRKTRRRFTAEEKIRIILEGLRGEESIKYKIYTKIMNSSQTIKSDGI